MIMFALFFSDLTDRGPKAIEGILDLFAKGGPPPDAFGEYKSRDAMLAHMRKDVSAGKIASMLFSWQGDTEPYGSVAVRPAGFKQSGVGSILRGALPAGSASKLATLATWGDVLHGYAHDAVALEYIPRENIPQPDEPFELLEVFSLNVFGKAIVEELGRERVLSTPGVTITKLPNGALLLDAGEDPKVHARALKHLRPDLDVTVREIPAAVAPTWDPVIAPFFESLIEWESAPDRNAKIAELNAFKPREVTEVRAKPLPANTKSPMRFKSVADDLVAILHDHVSLTAKPSPNIVPALDVHFYRGDYPGNYGRAKTDRLLEPLGAWLGQLLVVNLGGEWIPRAKLEENQVVVGKTVFLPFVRVQHYLASKQAVLEYSLTQYYAVAARAAGPAVR